MGNSRDKPEAPPLSEEERKEIAEKRLVYLNKIRRPSRKPSGTSERKLDSIIRDWQS